MEPMTLGSPGSPSPSSNNFLPAFLMGESNIPTTPRTNTLSPTKGRTLAFGQSPRGVGLAQQPSSPGDFNRSAMSTLPQRSLFGSQAPSTPAHGSVGGGPHQPQHPHQQQQQQLNASISGPPTQGLFDSLRSDNSGFPISQRNNNAVPASANQSVNQSYNQFNESVTDSFFNQSDFNVSRLTSPIRSANYDYRTPTALATDHQHVQNPLSPRQHSVPFWVTVFGFPQSATNTILAHFSQCGTIVDKVLPQQGGNWVHLKFASRLECDKAINYNERIIGNCLMIGVVYCRDANIVDKENLERNNIPVNRVRPLTHSAYHGAQGPTEVVLSPTMPKRSTGIVNKAMDMIFGW